MYSVHFPLTEKDREVWRRREAKGIRPLLQSVFSGTPYSCEACKDLTTRRYHRKSSNQMVCLSCLEPVDRIRLRRFIQE